MNERWADLKKAFPGRVRRTKKHLRQALGGWNHPKTATFVFGCQRSGTKMLLRVLDRSEKVRVYHENHGSAFSDFRLRSDRVLRLLIKVNAAHSVLFKPICDSQHADRLLGAFPDAHGIWIYRDFRDVALSAVQKWGSHQREVVQDLAAGNLAKWGWRAERLSEASLAELRSLVRPDLTDVEGGVLFWILRNRLWFDLELGANPRMSLVRYEDLVLDPARAFEAVFTHVGSPFETRFLDDVRSVHVGRRVFPDIDARIRAVAEDLLARLDAARPFRPTDEGREA